MRWCSVALALIAGSVLTIFSRAAAAAGAIYDVVPYDTILAEPDVYLTGQRALVIKGATLGWDAVNRLSPDYLLNLTAAFDDTNIADWYPESMARANVHPYLVKAESGLRSLAQAGRDGQPAYLQWRLRLDQAERVLTSMQPFPAFLRSISSDAWMAACLPCREARNNLMMVIAWYMLVIGVPGGGMFLHPDNYDSGTWQAQLVGTKEWTLCDPGRLRPGETLRSAGHYDTFAPGFTIGQPSASAPGFPHHACARIVAQPGDILVYPSRWWHQTRIPAQEELPPSHPNAGISIGLAGRWVNRVNYKEIAAAVEAKCRDQGPDISLQYKGAAPNPSPEVCEAVRSQCLKAWTRQFSATAAVSGAEG
jgi:hypothetical protein